MGQMSATASTYSRARQNLLPGRIMTWGNAFLLLLVGLLTLSLAIATGCAANSMAAPKSAADTSACVSKAGSNVQVPLLITSNAALGPCWHLS